MSNLHKDHRERMRKRFLEEGLANFPEHNVLELLLFYSIPRSDTNPIAHTLLAHFGNLSSVLDAPFEELMKIEGIGQSTATLIKLMPELSSAYHVSHAKDVKKILSEEDAAVFLMPKFIGLQKETLLVTALDTQSRIINFRKVSEGNLTELAVPIRDIIAFCIQVDAHKVIIAHNHPFGRPVPSREDFLSAKEITRVLKHINVEVADHMIFAGQEYFSMGACDDYFSDIEYL